MAEDRGITELSIIVPTFNEALNIPTLLQRIDAATERFHVEVLVVDDSTDNTPDVVLAEAPRVSMPVRLLHRDEPTGGLAGAVREGMAASRYRWCLVMDGDLQHPPELIPALVEAADDDDVDVVVASRYIGSGNAGGLANAGRRAVSGLSTSVTRAMFPRRLDACSDPMTGFFLVRRGAVDLDGLQPRGFKILLEILVRNRLRVTEIPFTFAERHAGESKASLVQGARFLSQLAALRFGRMSQFAVIGGLGALLNIAIVAILTGAGMGYLLAAVIAAEVTIVLNFIALERLVFADLRAAGAPWWSRFARSFAFNNVETALRMPILAVLVSTAHFAAVLATGVTLLVAFVLRFLFHAHVVYRPQGKVTRTSGIPDAMPSTLAAELP